MLRFVLAAACLLGSHVLTAAAAGSGTALLEIRPNTNWQDRLDLDDAGIAGDTVARARKLGLFGCRRYCALLSDVFGKIRASARSQMPESAAPVLELIVTRLPDDAAWALSDGHVFISEVFIHDAHLNRDSLAFVLAHEVSHALARDQADTLELARAMVPLGVNASVEDIYATMDFDLGVLIRMAPLLQDMENEADRNGLMLAALAGFDPDAALGYLRHQARSASRQVVMATHPADAARLARMESMLPMARRIRALNAVSGLRAIRYLPDRRDLPRSGLAP
ncbi:M48 family metalloprotease [Uliginosibacterium paludis]|uniref:M48 family metalloprotease n=1 Tax=Uliginosibacterium paludis TaxID=1615952 RepID=A0ABV2CLI6_9RHOO